MLMIFLNGQVTLRTWLSDQYNNSSHHQVSPLATRRQVCYREQKVYACICILRYSFVSYPFTPLFTSFARLTWPVIQFRLD
jgi:hypothetical protein